MKFNFYYRNNFLTSLRNDSKFSKKFKFSDTLIHFYLERWGFLVFKFGLFHNKIISPLFICFPEKKEKLFPISILNLNNYHSFSFPLSLTVLSLRLRPGSLKLIINGTFGILSFTLSFGFSSFCPIFITKRSKKTPKNVEKKRKPIRT